MIYEQVVYALEWNKGAVSAVILMSTCLIVLVGIAWLTHLASAWTRASRT